MQLVDSPHVSRTALMKFLVVPRVQHYFYNPFRRFLSPDANATWDSVWVAPKGAGKGWRANIGARWCCGLGGERALLCLLSHSNRRSLSISLSLPLALSLYVGIYRPTPGDGGASTAPESFRAWRVHVRRFGLFPSPVNGVRRRRRRVSIVVVVPPRRAERRFVLLREGGRRGIRRKNNLTGIKIIE